ncbi:3-hydroxyacyl-CoA dehydrogenase family protein [Amycolatopsis halotolerans]|uniref:3-hydroxyacyl-CoA dehydrogenase family protein n=1 Tax=Amycolatopsis halotolerans TaxID=330083 RepID=UPI00361FB6D6
MAAQFDNCRIAVFGAGVMGVDIATMIVSQGISVTVVDVNSAALERAREGIAKRMRHAALAGTVAEGVEPGNVTIAASFSFDSETAAVIEAITERADLKAGLLAEVSAALPAGIPVITNTSGIPIEEMAGWAARPAEVVGVHFMNPAYLIATVEVVRGPSTGAAALDRVLELLARLNRKPVVVRDSPGFVTSRLLHPMLNAAARLVGAGTATAQEVDALMEGCLGHPVGPLRTADLIGLDNLVDSLAALHERTGEESCRPCGVLEEKVRNGHLGRKSGQGFYDYGKEPW